jgi:hypothetical protein
LTDHHDQRVFEDKKGIQTIPPHGELRASFSMAPHLCLLRLAHDSSPLTSHSTSVAPLLTLIPSRIRNMAAEIEKEIELEIAPVLFIEVVGVFEAFH